MCSELGEENLRKYLRKSKKKKTRTNCHITHLNIRYFGYFLINSQLSIKHSELPLWQFLGSWVGVIISKTLNF